MARGTILKIGAALVLAVTGCAQNAYAQANSATASDENREQNLLAYTELLRSDIRTHVVAIITGVMQFSEDEDAKFWPVYREFETALSKINDERMKMIADYATKYDTLTDADADRQAIVAHDLQGRRHQLEVEYYNHFKSALSPKTAARFFQVEHQLLLLLDLQIASSLPVASR